MPHEYSCLTDTKQECVECKWIIEKPEIQVAGTSYRSACVISHGMRQCMANIKAGLKFDKEDYETIEKNGKSIVMSKFCGDMMQGYRNGVLQQLCKYIKAQSSSVAMTYCNGDLGFSDIDIRPHLIIDDFAKSNGTAKFKYHNGDMAFTD